MESSNSGILQWFECQHLHKSQLLIVNPLKLVAELMDGLLPDGEEKMAGMRKLLEAKDCFVRASLPQR